jgi:hypothetical protein
MGTWWTTLLSVAASKARIGEGQGLAVIGARLDGEAGAEAIHHVDRGDLSTGNSSEMHCAIAPVPPPMSSRCSGRPRHSVRRLDSIAVW